MSNHTQTTRTTPRRGQASVPIPLYDDDPPPYPVDEVRTIGWSPRVAIITNNLPPNTQVTMPLPMVQYSTMPMPTTTTPDNSCPIIEPLPATYAFTRRTLSPTVSSIIVPHISHSGDGTPTTTSSSRRTHTTHPATVNRIRIYDQRRTVLIIFGIIALIGILLVITIAIVSRKNIDVYRTEISAGDSGFSHT